MMRPMMVATMALIALLLLLCNRQRSFVVGGIGT
jgi:hypothetical protein